MGLSRTKSYEQPRLQPGDLTAALGEIAALLPTSTENTVFVRRNLEGGTVRTTQATLSELEDFCTLRDVTINCPLGSVFLRMDGTGLALLVNLSAHSLEQVNTIFGILESRLRLQERPPAPDVESPKRGPTNTSLGIDPSELTIAQILSSLRPRHMVAIVVGLGALLGAAYSAGLNVAQMKRDKEFADCSAHEQFLEAHVRGLRMAMDEHGKTHAAAAPVAMPNGATMTPDAGPMGREVRAPLP